VFIFIFQTGVLSGIAIEQRNARIPLSSGRGQAPFC
jgi:hypothetical protein